MPLRPGARLGSYEVQSLVGAGGMGEVYRARDTKLGREVALKILPDAFRGNADRLARFKREARVLAALNHPNIAAIYGLEESDGTPYLIMELVAGETLADRIGRQGALPVGDALAIARQVARGLEAAHEQGIVHRDLKPANVSVTPDGTVKILDFGLAKAFAGDAAGGDPADSPTMSLVATVPGVLLGTAAYMSPEQASGKTVDRRTDLWAFGCVLYEMLSGRWAFDGEGTTEILAAVVRAEPDWQALPPATPPKVRDLLRRCLQKDKTLRMRDAGDARLEIDEALAAPGTGEPPGAVNAIRTPGGWRPVVLAGASLAAAAIAGLGVWYLKPAPPSPPRPVSRTVIPLPPGARLAALDQLAVAISPDGRRIAYVATRAGRQQLYVRVLDSLETHPLAHTDGATTPFFSPDGQWLGFFGGGQLKKISVDGGAAVTLCDARGALQASWGGGGTIVFAGAGGPLQQVSDTGGTPRPLTRLEAGDVFQLWPELLPGGRAVLFAVAPPQRIAVSSLETGQRRYLIQDAQPATAPHYLRPGYLIYSGAEAVMAAPFDARTLRVTGDPVPVVEGVVRTRPVLMQYSLSATGSLVYVSGSGQRQLRLVWVDRTGIEQPLSAPPRPYLYPRLSPAGRRIAVSIRQSDIHVWLYDPRRNTLTRWTNDGSVNLAGLWSPDGRQIAFYSNRGEHAGIFRGPADDTRRLEELFTSKNLATPNSWSPDGQTLAFIQLDPTTAGDIWMLRLSDRQARPFLQTSFDETAPTFSPDGRWLAYVSDESGRPEVYVRPYPGPGRAWQISTEGGTEPVWNPGGHELFYRDGNKMMAVPVTSQPAFSPGRATELFEGPYVPTPITYPNYDVSADGKRFLMLKPSGDSQEPSQITVVLNWIEELKRLVPGGR